MNNKTLALQSNHGLVRVDMDETIEQIGIQQFIKYYGVDDIIDAIVSLGSWSNRAEQHSIEKITKHLNIYMRCMVAEQRRYK